MNINTLIKKYEVELVEANEELLQAFDPRAYGFVEGTIEVLNDLLTDLRKMSGAAS